MVLRNHDNDNHKIPDNNDSKNNIKKKKEEGEEEYPLDKGTGTDTDTDTDNDNDTGIPATVPPSPFLCVHWRTGDFADKVIITAITLLSLHCTHNRTYKLAVNYPNLIFGSVAFSGQ